MRLALAAAAVSIGLATVAACLGGDPAEPHGPPPSGLDAGEDAAEGGGGCQRVLPPCPDAGQPSWEASVAHIVAGRCAYCHSPAGMPPQVPDLSTYANVHGAFGASLDQVYTCAMPPSTEGPIPDSDRTTLLTWLVCGAPDN